MVVQAGLLYLLQQQVIHGGKLLPQLAILLEQAVSAIDLILADLQLTMVVAVQEVSTVVMVTLGQIFMQPLL